MKYPHQEPAPEFVITGWTNPDGTVCVVGSVQLDMAELETVQEYPLSFDIRDMSHVRYRHRLGFVMEEYVIQMGPDYPTALADLFKHWNPTSKTRDTCYGVDAPPTTREIEP